MTKRFKFCRKCQTTKPLEDYYVRATGRVEAWCKPCTIKDANSRKAEKRRLAREERAARPAPPPPTEKRCYKCGRTKPIAEFQRRSATAWRGACKVCLSEYREEWLSQPGVRQVQTAMARESAERNRDARRARRLAKYGLTPDEYDDLYERQFGRCLICGIQRARVGDGSHGGSDVLCVDHHHGTGEVRGLLCSGCNGGLGLLGDDIGRLLAAIEYLRQRDPDDQPESQEGHRPEV